MIDQDFLKTLTILYVEDDKKIRDGFLSILDKLFYKVLVAEDGQDALDIFKSVEENTIDTIISDINLPNVNGIDLLENIRKIDESVPFIFTSGHKESRYLLKAVKLGVSNYFTKPFDAKEIILYVQKVCEKIHQESRIIHYQKEIKKYLNVIDQVAIVAHINKHNEFVFINEFFSEVTGYKEEEIIGKSTMLLKPDDVADDLYNSMWLELKSGKVWRGKLKRITKSGDPFYVSTTVFPIYDEENDRVEYILIEFQTTEDENEKREFKKKVMYNLQETRRINTVARKKIDELQVEIKNLKEQLRSYRHFDVLEDKLKAEKTKTKDLKNQVEYYEDLISAGKKRYEKVSNEVTQRIYVSQTVAHELRKKNNDLEMQTNKLNSVIEEKEKEKEDLLFLIKRHEDTISILEDTVQEHEERLERINND